MVTGSKIMKLSAAVVAVALASLTLGVAGAAAQTTSVTSTGSYLHFPKVVVWTTDADAIPALAAGDYAQDTVIQITNTSNERIDVNCHYVNANRHCGGPPGSGPVCRTNADCPTGIQCIPGWQSLDFQLPLTPRQPIGWTASTGLTRLPCFNCAPPNNQSGLVPEVPEQPFIGELRCFVVESDVDDTPVENDVLKGEATIVESGPFGAPTQVLSAAYNSISFQATADGQGGDALCIGGAPAGATCAASYTPCAANLSLQHYFDGAETGAGEVRTELTLSPCSAALETGDLIAPANRVVALMLVYNEFEQRFSTGTVVDCLENLRLVDIDTPRGPAGDAFSLFAVGTQGTLGGQTRIKGETSDNGYGPGLVAVAHQYFEDDGGTVTSSSAYQVNGNFAAQPIPDAVYPPVP